MAEDTNSRLLKSRRTAEEKAMHSEMLHRLVVEYCQRHALPLFEVLPLKTPTEIWQDNDLRESPGCYALYDAEKRLRYVGASLKVKERSCNHLSPAVQARKFWQGRPAKYVQLIKTREPWEPWSLEVFLTMRTDMLGKRDA